jgi:hypothetical protein
LDECSDILDNGNEQRATKWGSILCSIQKEWANQVDPGIYLVLGEAWVAAGDIISEHGLLAFLLRFVLFV